MLDANWKVPDDYDIAERTFGLPPPRSLLPTAPMLGVLSLRALEDQASGDGMFSLYAWQVMAGANAVATETIERIAHTPELSGLALLVLGHAYVATGAGGGSAFEIAQRARKLLKVSEDALSIDASLLLAVTALPYGNERVRTLLEKLEPELARGTDEHRAVHALVRAAADPDPARLDDAHARLVALDDHFGVAQCALLAYTREAEATKRPAALRGYLEHAIYRYESDGRPEWAARTISHALVPLLVDQLAVPASEAGALLGRAASLAVEARSELALEAVFRMATKLGFTATVTALGPFDPPEFTRREAPAVAAAGDAPAATDAATNSPPAEAPKGKKRVPAKRGSKKKAAPT
jgi:hypothetical protein